MSRALERFRVGVPPDVKQNSGMDFAEGRGGSFAGPSLGSLLPSPPPASPPRLPVASEAPFARIVFPPRIEKIPTSADFNVADYAMAVPAGVGGTVTSATLAFTLPATMVGWLQQVFLYVLSPLATTSLSWSVRINGGPVPGFTALRNPPGAANFLLITTNDVRVRLPQSCVVDVQITNVDGAAITAGGLLAGWYHPLSDELRVYGEGA